MYGKGEQEERMATSTFDPISGCVARDCPGSVDDFSAKSSDHRDYPKTPRIRPSDVSGIDNTP